MKSKAGSKGQYEKLGVRYTPVVSQDVEGLVKRNYDEALSDGFSYLFSVVMPVYNTKEHVAEAIDSVVGQSVGFEHTQLILVDDGSTDGSIDVLKQYAETYKDNVVLIAKSNGGVSSARNAAIPSISGKWVNFLDSDDLWSSDAFEVALRFHELHPHVKMISERHWFFGASVGEHALNYKFEHDRVIDTFKDSGCPHLTFSNAFFDASLIKGIEFDTDLEVSEDFALVNELIMDIRYFGVCSDGRYFYRRRVGGGSAINEMANKLSYYEVTPYACYLKLFESSIKRFGEVIRYIQYCVMYDLQWRLKQEIPPILDDTQRAKYKDVLRKLLASIDDEVIVNQRNLTINHFLYAVSLKYGVEESEILNNIEFVGDQWLWNNGGRKIRLRPGRLIDKGLYVDFISSNDDGVLIEGYCNFISEEARGNLAVVFQADGIEYEAEYTKRYDKYETMPFSEDSVSKLGFKVFIPIAVEREAIIEAFIRFDCLVFDANLVLNKFSGLSNRLSNAYTVKNKRIIYRVDGANERRRLHVAPYSKSLQASCESRVTKEIIAKRKDAAHLLVWRAIGLNVRLRTAAESKRLWLISDRPMKAGDNGEALFIWLANNPVEGVEPAFVISKKSPDYTRLSSIGKVIDYGSKAHRAAVLRADLILSASGDEYDINPFEGRSEYVRDLYHFKYVFLQHGITKDDISPWFNRYNKNASLIVTAAQRERLSMQNDRYAYAPEVVKTTGFPRHDSLVEASKMRAPEKLIYIIPTWRKNLVVGAYDISVGMYPQNPAFESSDYYRFYQGLISDSDLLKALRTYGYKMKLVMHPSFIQEASKFRCGEHVDVLPKCNYRDVFTSGALLVTDYSSVAFDFALLKKPVIYTQFDRNTFFSGHTYKEGYFSYEDDGFGPVCTDLHETVSAIIENLQHGCAMDDGYSKRVDEFYGEQPASRCAALVDELLRL